MFLGSLGMATNGAATNSSDCAVNLSTPSDSPAKGVNPFSLTGGYNMPNSNHTSAEQSNNNQSQFNIGVSNHNESQAIEINVPDLLGDDENTNNYDNLLGRQEITPMQFES